MKKTPIYFLLVMFAFSLQSCKNDSNKEVRFLTFNVWQEGTSVPNGLLKIRNVITKTNPDIVCFVEVRNYKEQDWTTKIVTELEKEGRKYYRGYAGGDVSFISKYPLSNGKLIFGNEDKGTVVNFDVLIGRKTIVVSGAHLDYTYYASNLPRGYYGGTPNWRMIDNGHGKPLPTTDLDSLKVYNLKSTRDEAIAAFLASVDSSLKPVILMGDFNEPSWLDWTKKTKNMFNHSGVIFPWNSTKSLAEKGFIDSYRKMHPNEITHPGFTWPANANEKKSTSWTPLADERDRIDFIFYKGKGMELKNATLVGSKELYIHNKLAKPTTDQEKIIATDLPWPSDHRAVLATFLIK